MKKLLCASVYVALLAGTEDPAFARFNLAAASSDDRCNSVLQNGTMRFENYRDNSYFRNIMYSRFLSSTYEQSKNDRSLGFGVPVGEIVLGGNYTEAQFNEKKAYIQRTMFSQIDASREIDWALVSGDSTIVEAWSKCMQDAGGRVGVRIKSVSPTQAVAEINWLPGRAGTQTGVVTTRLRENIAVPDGVQVLSGADCLRRKYRLSEDPCAVTFKMPNARFDLLLTANAEHGSNYAYLPPRLTFRREVRYYPISDADRLHQWAKNGVWNPARTITLTKEEIDAGWHFDPTAIDTPIVVDLNQRWVNKCDSLQQKVTLETVYYTYRAFGESKNGKDRKAGIQCHIEPNLRMVRDVWAPADKALPPIPLSAATY